MGKAPAGGGVLQGINKQKERMSLCGKPSGPVDQTLKAEVSESGPLNRHLGLEHGEV